MAKSWLRSTEIRAKEEEEMGEKLDSDNLRAMVKGLRHFNGLEEVLFLKTISVNTGFSM